jgi:hypothetical protein
MQPALAAHPGAEPFSPERKSLPFANLQAGFGCIVLARAATVSTLVRRVAPGADASRTVSKILEPGLDRLSGGEPGRAQGRVATC